MSWRPLYVLVACEESQAGCSAFRALGHIAFSCDIKPCRRGGNPDWHIVGDCRPYLQSRHVFYTQSGKLQRVPGWDLIIAHPPCTYLTKAGIGQLYKNPDFVQIRHNVSSYINSARYVQMLKAREFFMECLCAASPYLAVENPIPMAMANLPKPSTYACPSWYGSKYSKKTLYWLRNLPDLMPAICPGNVKSLVYCSRGIYRSRTYPGLAAALAKQWSQYILDNL